MLPPYADAAYCPLFREALVVMVEAVMLSRVLMLDAKWSLACSFVMNAASFLLGLVLL